MRCAGYAALAGLSMGTATLLLKGFMLAHGPFQLIVAIVAGGIGLAIFQVALHKGDSPTVNAVVVGTMAVIGVFGGWSLLGEQISPGGWAGIAGIGTGIAILALKSK